MTVAECGTRPERRLRTVARALLPVSLALHVMLLGCRGGDQALAVVGGRPVRQEALRAVVEAQTGRPFGEAPKELISTLFEGLLEEEVVLAAGGVPEDRSLPPVARGARVRELLLTLCPPPLPPTDAEVQAFLATRGAPAADGGERLRLRQLILPDEAGARAAREKLRRGEDFVAVSRELSRAPNAADGGMLGWFEKGQLPPEFEAAVLGLLGGQVSEPVASNAGWHVFEVMERQTASVGAELAEREQARAELASTKAETAQQKCLRRLATQVGVEVYGTGLGFEVRNPFGEIKHD